MPHILVVDDEQAARGSIRRVLEDAGFSVTTVASGAEALETLRTQPVDLLVLDIIMPQMSGIDVCRRIRSDPFLSKTPVIFLTAKSRPEDIAEGLDAGGDDYITKPLEVLELPARIRAMLRRAPGGALDKESDIIQVPPVKLYLTKFQAEIGEQIVELSTLEHRLLHTLMLHAGKPLPVDRLLQDVWEYPAGVGDPALVYVHIGNLRAKLDAASEDGQSIIENVRGRGYMIAA